MSKLEKANKFLKVTCEEIANQSYFNRDYFHSSLQMSIDFMKSAENYIDK